MMIKFFIALMVLRSPAYSNECQMIGQQHRLLRLEKLFLRLQYPDGVAGEIVGKGYGNMTGDKVVDLLHLSWLFLAVYSAVPRRVYTPCGNPREYSDLYRFDFVQPELMNLGQQPLFWTEFDLPSFYFYLSYCCLGTGVIWKKKCRVGMAMVLVTF